MLQQQYSGHYRRVLLIKVTSRPVSIDLNIFFIKIKFQIVLCVKFSCFVYLLITLGPNTSSKVYALFGEPLFLIGNYNK